MGYSPPGYSVYGISQIRILEWKLWFQNLPSLASCKTNQLSLPAGNWWGGEEGCEGEKKKKDLFSEAQLPILQPSLNISDTDNG